MLPGWLADTSMTDNPAINSSQASGGKVWNPYNKPAEGKQQTSDLLPSWMKKPIFFIPAILAYLVVTTLLVIKGLHTIAYVNSPLKNFVKAGIFYQEVHRVSLLDMFLLQLIAISATILLMTIMLVTSRIIRKKTKKSPRNFINVMAITTIMLDLGIVFGSMCLPTQTSNNEGYDAWLKQELGVTTVNRILPGGTTETLLQGKDGNYKLEINDKEEYTIFKLVKAEGK